MDDNCHYSDLTFVLDCRATGVTTTLAVGKRGAEVLTPRLVLGFCPGDWRDIILYLAKGTTGGMVGRIPMWETAGAMARGGRLEGTFSLAGVATTIGWFGCW